MAESVVKRPIQFDGFRYRISCAFQCLQRILPSFHNLLENGKFYSPITIELDKVYSSVMSVPLASVQQNLAHIYMNICQPTLIVGYALSRRGAPPAVRAFLAISEFFAVVVDQYSPHVLPSGPVIFGETMLISLHCTLPDIGVGTVGAVHCKKI